MTNEQTVVNFRCIECSREVIDPIGNLLSAFSLAFQTGTSLDLVCHNCLKEYEQRMSPQEGASAE